MIARLRGLAWRWAALGGVGLALLLAPGAHATEFADPTVVTPLFLEDLHGGNPLLSHNVPNLLLVIGGLEHRASFRDHFLATGKIERWGLATSEVLREEPNSLTQYYQRGVVDYHLRSDLGGAWVIERRLVWDYVGGGRAGSTDQGTELETLNSNPGIALGPWGHRVANLDINGRAVGFMDFYQRLGGEASFGYPKTEARADTGSPGTLLAPGSTTGFVRQYFQAAVFEHHPGDPQDPVKLTLLGDILRDLTYPAGYWYSLVPFRGASALQEGDRFEILEVVPLTRAPDPANVLPPNQLYGFGSRTSGLLVWDGVNWRTVEVANSSLASDTVRSLFVDADRGLWLGTDGGAFYFPYFAPDRNVVVDAAGFGLAGNVVSSIAGRSGRIILLAVNQGGLAQYVQPAFGSTRGSVTTLPTGGGGLPSSEVRDVVMAAEFPPQIYAATDRGLAFFNGSNWRTLTTMQGLPDLDVTAVAVAASGEIWVGTAANGMAVSITGVDGQFTSYGLDDGLPALDVTDILLAGDGSVWVATGGGLAVIGPGQFGFTAHRQSATGLPSDTVRALAEDDSGRILVATGGGAAVFDPADQSWRRFVAANGIPDEDLLSVTVIPALL